jgi:LmbE family N-acetylglucosaminyl deacetylase
MWSAKGHKVKLVSVTNGDIGHWRGSRGPLARRRTAEVRAAAAFSVSRPRCWTSTMAS